ncbi:MAG: transpeptidase family protein [Treponemataceae bacterium]|nr:transpeptidase family protein [Treponemataceae bacterium]
MEVNSFFKKSRLIVVAVVFALFTLYILQDYVKLAFTPVTTVTKQVTKIERGSILDRTGKPLAVDTTFYDVAITPSVFKNYLDETGAYFALALNMTEDELTAKVNDAPATFTYLKKKIDEKTREQLAEIVHRYHVQGIRFDAVAGRIYPENTLASQVVGFMGSSGKGLSGMEYSMQSVLTPELPVLDTAYPTKGNMDPVLRGKNVYLTIDATLQYKLEKVVQKTMETTGAESVMLIAAEAKTGEILSYISAPAANLNTYGTSSSEEQIDRPAAYAYEPGSVFKIFSVASFLDMHGIKPDDRFLCDGRFEITGKGGEKAVINCLDHHGWLTAREALEYSCNDVLAQMSQTVDNENFLQYLKNFGFGSKTGIELPSETRGSIKSTSDKLWSLRSKPTMSIGQEISVSALQMVQAATAIANGGTPVQLSLVSQISDYDGTVEYEHTPLFKDPVISAGTARNILDYMHTTAQKGTGARANIKDISIGVKTGTAQMLDAEKGGYSETDFVSNCMAIFPVENPQIILYLVVTKAKGETYAGRIVAPVIGEAADIIIDHLGMFRSGAASYIHNGKVTFYTGRSKELTTTVPDFTGTPKKLLLPLLERDDLQILIQGDGYVVSQSPQAGTPVTENMKIELYLQ